MNPHRTALISKRVTSITERIEEEIRDVYWPTEWLKNYNAILREFSGENVMTSMHKREHREKNKWQKELEDFHTETQELQEPRADYEDFYGYDEEQMYKDYCQDIQDDWSDDDLFDDYDEEEYDDSLDAFDDDSYCDTLDALYQADIDRDEIEHPPSGTHIKHKKTNQIFVRTVRGEFVNISNGDILSYISDVSEWEKL